MKKGLPVLALLTVAAVVLAAIARRDSSASTPSTAAKLFPGLDARVNDVAKIRVEKNGKSSTIERAGSEWKLADRGGYPAKFEQAKKMVVRMAELAVDETKTAKKENHARLGVAWPATGAEGTDEGDAALVTLQDAAGNELAALVVGKSEWRGSAPKLYVRKLAEDQVYQVTGPLDVAPDPASWIEPKFIEIPNERVQEVTITHADGERVEIARSATDHTRFSLLNVPPGQSERFEGVADGVAQALGYGMTLEDVRLVAEVDFTKEPLGLTRFRCTDGLELVFEVAKLEDKIWAKVTASYVAPPEDAPAPETPPAEGAPAEPEKEKKDVGKEAADLNARLSPWAFAIPSYKSDVLVRRLKDLLAEPPPAEGADLENAPIEGFPIEMGGDMEGDMGDEDGEAVEVPPVPDDKPAGGDAPAEAGTEAPK